MADANRMFARLSDARDVEVAPGEPDIRGWDVVTTDDRIIGEVDDLIVDENALKVRFIEIDLDKKELGLDRGRHVVAPIERAQLDTDQHQVVLAGMSREAITSLPASADEAWRSGSTARPNADTTATTAPPAASAAAGENSRRLTRSAEELRIGKRQVQAGEVVVGKHVETEHVRQPVTTERERVNIERRPVTGDARADATISGSGEIRVPVVEEEVVVDKRPVVKEEIVVSKERVSETKNVDADLEREEFDIKKDGRVDEPSRGRGIKGGHNG